MAQSSGGRQMPSLPEEAVQPAASPAKPRAVAFDGYLLVAALELATMPRPRMATEAVAVTAIRRGSEESIGAPHSSYCAQTGDYRILGTHRHRYRFTRGRT